MSIYMDYNATTPLAPSVVEKITSSLVSDWGNPSSLHEPGLIAKRAVDDARAYIAEMIGAENSDIIFTSGGTEANNMVIMGVCDYFKSWTESLRGVNDKPHVITSAVEHDATIKPLEYLERRGDISLSLIPVDSSNGCVNVEDVMSAVRPTTCLVSIMQANNETGVVMPIQEIGRRVKEVNRLRTSDGVARILFHTDAAQAIGKVAVDVNDLGVDYLTVVGHKFYGPRIGCLYVRGRMTGLTPVNPLLHGGGQEDGHRPGTLNTPMIVGLGWASRLVSEHLATYRENMRQQRDHLEAKLKEAFGNDVIFNCRTAGVLRLPNTSSVCFPGEREELRGHAILSRCRRVMASVGAACHDQTTQSSVLIRSGVLPDNARNTIRLSVGRDTTASDIDAVVEDLRQAIENINSMAM